MVPVHVVNIPVSLHPSLSGKLSAMNLEMTDNIMPLTVPMHFECLGTVIEDMKQCLPLPTELVASCFQLPFVQ